MGFPVVLRGVEALDRQFKTGISTEHSYRPLLQGLLEEMLPGVEVTNEPQRIECGAPDFIVEHGSVPLGYIETKDVYADLDKVEKSDQLKRYRQSLNNDIIWCFGNAAAAYHCSTAALVGVTNPAEGGPAT